MAESCSSFSPFSSSCPSSGFFRRPSGARPSASCALGSPADSDTSERARSNGVGLRSRSAPGSALAGIPRAAIRRERVPLPRVARRSAADVWLPADRLYHLAAGRAAHQWPRLLPHRELADRAPTGLVTVLGPHGAAGGPRRRPPRSARVSRAGFQAPDLEVHRGQARDENASTVNGVRAERHVLSPSTRSPRAARERVPAFPQDLYPAEDSTRRARHLDLRGREVRGPAADVLPAARADVPTTTAAASTARLVSPSGPELRRQPHDSRGVEGGSRGGSNPHH